MRDEVQIRPATIEDIPAIARVHVDAWWTTYRGIVPDEYLASLSHEGRERMWRAVLGEFRDRHVAYVADHPKFGVVGFALASGTSDPEFKGEVLALYVLAAHQRGGIGRRLLAAVVRELVERGMASLMLWVLRDNPSRGFYEALGGRVVREKTEEIGGAVLVEVAYGWDDAGALLPEDSVRTGAGRSGERSDRERDDGRVRAGAG